VATAEGPSALVDRMTDSYRSGVTDVKEVAMTSGDAGRIVVGIDGSGAAEAAVAWALDEAQRRGSRLELVHVWQFPGVAMAAYGHTKVPVVTADDLHKAADQFMTEALAATREQSEGVEVTGTVERGHSADALVAAAKGADLLVVGSRGLGGFAGMLLGSVSSHVVQHATCPVVVVRSLEG